MSNLAIAFPEKTATERKKIAKQFYRNFTDAMLESIKLISAGPRLIDRMFFLIPAYLMFFPERIKTSRFMPCTTSIGRLSTKESPEK